MVIIFKEGVQRIWTGIEKNVQIEWGGERIFISFVRRNSKLYTIHTFAVGGPGNLCAKHNAKRSTAFSFHRTVKPSGRHPVAMLL